MFHRLAVIAAIVTLIVIVLGAWVRLTDAGLGCPDWPGCYGMLTWPSSEAQIAQADQVRPERAVDSGKAFREMFHRYAAGFLGFLVLAMAVVAWRNFRKPGPGVVLPTLLLALVVFQALLGMWTVTLLLKPAIVMAHLMGGMLIFALIVWLALRSRHASWQPSVHAQRQRSLVVLALIVVALQIALGGWVSSNYAALACAGDFPQCLGQWWPETDFAEGFVLWREVGVDYEGGILDQPARAAIHMAHRIGAVVTLGVLGWLIWNLIADGVLRRVALALAAVLAVQLTLGIANIVLGLPLHVAVAHNGVAALLLGMLIYLLHRTLPSRAK